MTNSEIRRLARAKIKDGKQNHQEVYENLESGDIEYDQHMAYLLSRVPTSRVIQRNKIVNWLYIFCLTTYLILNIMDMSHLFEYIFMLDIATIAIIFLLLSIPIAGILGAVKFIKWSYPVIATCFLLFLIFILVNVAFIDGKILLPILVCLGVVILGYVIHSRLNTPYTSKIETKTINDKKVSKLIIKFEDTEDQDKHDFDREVLDNVF